MYMYMCVVCVYIPLSSRSKLSVSKLSTTQEPETIDKRPRDDVVQEASHCPSMAQMTSTSDRVPMQLLFIYIDKQEPVNTVAICGKFNGLNSEAPFDAVWSRIPKIP